MAQYLTRLTLFTTLLLALVAGLSVIVDPYDYWGTPPVSGVNVWRPASGKHLAVVKQRQYARADFTAIVAGNSRVGVGLDPADAAWPASVRPVYNLGLPGQGPDGVVDAAIRAAERHKPRAIYLGVDFIDFRIAPDQWASGPRPKAPATAAWRETLAVTLSLDALSDTILSLAGQHRSNGPHIRPDGFNNLAEYNDLVAQDGHFILFEQRNRENVARYVTGPKAVAYPGPGRHGAWDALARLAAYAKAHDIALVLFTYPYHAELRLSLDVAGLAPAYADWVRRLADFGARHAVPVYYFSGLTPQTQETVPPRGDRETRLRYYWEAGHFKAALGSLMIADMAGLAPPRLGQRLQPSLVPAILAADAAALQAYARAQPQRTARIMAAAEAAR